MADDVDLAEIDKGMANIQQQPDPEAIWVGIGENGLHRACMSFTELYTGKNRGDQSEWVRYLNLLEAGRSETTEAAYAYLHQRYHALLSEVKELRHRLAKSKQSDG